MADKPNRRVLVLGGGGVAVEVASRISQAGYQVAIATEKGDPKECGGWETAVQAGDNSHVFRQSVESLKSEPAIEIWTDTSVSQTQGYAGNFSVALRKAGRTEERNFGAIVVTSGIYTKDLKERYHLKGKERVLSLSELEEIVESDASDCKGKTVAFLHGLAAESNPLEFGRLLSAVSRLRELGGKAYVLLDNIKLTEFPLDRKYHEARAKGAIFVKSPVDPEFSIDGDRLRVEFLDSALNRKIELAPDRIVVDEEYLPSENNGSLSARLGVNLSGNGFLQAENVHNLTVRTNRKGILVAGAGKQLQNASDSAADVDNVLHELHRLFQVPAADGETPCAEVDPEKCVICLTCYRACQHGAIAWVDGAAKVHTQVCLGCGMCASECPMNAIQVSSYSDRTLAEKIGKAAAKPHSLIVFCCKNSAIEARDAALKLSLDLAPNLEIVELPCAGKLDAELLMQALTGGADGILALGCHPGNCKSEKGSGSAKNRVDEIRRLLETIGIEKERVRFGTVAANMGASFHKLTMQMANTIRELGPSTFK